MKRILIPGLCALLIACSSSTEKTTNADSSSVTMADTTPVVSNTDTSVVSNPEPETIASKSADIKTAEKPSKSPETKSPEPQKPVQPASNSNTDIKQGEILISKSDCFACHKVQEKLLGPSYKDVANKYANTKANIDYLVTKIKEGGSGVWGPVPMSPHPALSDQDAKAMVQYILSLK